MYADDSDPDEPNPAIKLLWPSTHAYAELLWLASKLSDSYARERLNTVFDPEIRAIVGIELAGYWEEIKPWNETSPFASPKHRNGPKPSDGNSSQSVGSFQNNFL